MDVLCLFKNAKAVVSLSRKAGSGSVAEDDYAGAEVRVGFLRLERDGPRLFASQLVFEIWRLAGGAMALAK